MHAHHRITRRSSNSSRDISGSVVWRRCSEAAMRRLTGTATAALAGVVFPVAVGGHDPFAWDTDAFVVALGGAFTVLVVLELRRRA